MTAPIILIGGEAVELKPVSFAVVRKIAPLLEQMQTVGSEVEMRGMMIGILAPILGRTSDDLEATMTWIEAGTLAFRFGDILSFAGLVQRTGEALATSSPPSASTI